MKLIEITLSKCGSEDNNQRGCTVPRHIPIAYATWESDKPYLWAALGHVFGWLGSQVVNGGLLAGLSLHLRLSCQQCCILLDTCKAWTHSLVTCT